MKNHIPNETSFNSREAQEGISGVTKARQIDIRGDTLYPAEYL